MSGSSIFRILFNEPISDLHGGGYAAYLACVSFVGSEEEWIQIIAKTFHTAI